MSFITRLTKGHCLEDMHIFLVNTNSHLRIKTCKLLATSPINHIVTFEYFEWSVTKPRKFRLHPYSSHRNTTMHAYISFDKMRHLFQNLRKLYASQRFYITHNQKLEIGNSLSQNSHKYQGQLELGTSFRHIVCTDKIHTTANTKL